MTLKRAKRKSVAEMLGDLCREAGVLLAVFGVMEPFMSHHRITDPHEAYWLWVRAAISIELMVFGIIQERGRQS